MQKVIPGLVISVVFGVTAPLAAEPPGEGWELVFHDEFQRQATQLECLDL